MTKLRGLIGPTYPLSSLAYEAQRTVNMYLVTDDLGTGKEQEPAMMASVPGQACRYRMPKSPIRAMHRTSQGYLICVAGNTVYKLVTSDGISFSDPVPIADLTTSAGHCSIADGIPNFYNGAINLAEVSVVVVVDGSTKGILFEEEDVTQCIQLNNGNAFQGASFVCFQDGYFFFTQATASNQGFYASDPTNISALDYFTPNLGADYISCIFSDHDILWVFGARSSSVWQNTGSATNTFQNIPGSYAEGGIASPWSLAKVSGQLLWVSQDQNGHGMVFQASGYRGVRVSNWAVDNWLKGFSDLSLAKAWAYQDGGHSFYALNVPGATSTWVYDLSTQQWCERGRFADGVWSRDVVDYHVLVPDTGTHLIASSLNNKLYTLSNAYDLDGEPIYRLRTSPYSSAGFNRVFYSQVQIDAEPGVGLDGAGFAYKVGVSTATTSTTTTTLLYGPGPTFKLIGNDGEPVTDHSGLTVEADGEWSESYASHAGDSVTIDTASYTPSGKFGIGNDVRKNWSFVVGGLAAGTTLGSAIVYVSDWRSVTPLAQSSTPITNLCKESIDFASPVWAGNGVSVLPSAWKSDIPSTYMPAYRPSASNILDPVGPAIPLWINAANAYDCTLNTLKTDGTYSKIYSTGSTNGVRSCIYSAFGVGGQVSGTIYLSMRSFTHEATNSLVYVTRSLDGGVTWSDPLVPAGWAAASAGANPFPEFNPFIPLAYHLTIPDMSKFQIKIWVAMSTTGLQHTEIYDIVFVPDAVVGTSTKTEKAPDGTDTGTYLVEDDSFGVHSLVTQYQATASSNTTFSCYYQKAASDPNREFELFAATKPLSFVASVAGNQLTVLTPPVSGSLAVGMTISIDPTVALAAAAQIPNGCKITAGTSSPYTLDFTAPTDAPISAIQMAACKYLLSVRVAPVPDIVAGTTATVVTNVGTFGAAVPVTTVFSGSISGDQLEVDTLYSGTLGAGMVISGVGISGTPSIVSGTESPYTLSASPGDVTHGMMSVASGGIDTGIWRVSGVGTSEPLTQENYCGIALWAQTSPTNVASTALAAYPGNGGSRVGLWGFMAQKGAITPFIKSSDGISGVDCVTLDLTNELVAFAMPPSNGAVLTWDGTATGVSLHPTLFHATFTYEAHTPVTIPLGIDPKINLCYSDDGGKTFGPERPKPLGKIGEYRQRAIWRRLGQSRARCFRVTCCEPVKFNLLGGEFLGEVANINKAGGA